MRKRIIAFYDVLLYAMICGPMMVVAILLLIELVSKGTREWIYENWYLIVIFAISFMIPIAGKVLVRYCLIENNSMHFYYFPFTTSWEKASNNIDIRWNQDVIISEIQYIEVVKLTQEEKKTKVFYKHWINKYLKINLKYGNPKYIYVGNFSNRQIKKIIAIVSNLNHHSCR